jgi:hypothetical protein
LESKYLIIVSLFGLVIFRVYQEIQDVRSDPLRTKFTVFQDSKSAQLSGLIKSIIGLFASTLKGY